MRAAVKLGGLLGHRMSENPAEGVFRVAEVVSVQTGSITVTVGPAEMDDVSYLDSFTPSVGDVVLIVDVGDGDVCAIGRVA